MGHHPHTTPTSLRPCAPAPGLAATTRRRWRSWWGILLLLAAFLAVPALADPEATPERGVAFVAIQSDLTDAHATDRVLIQLVGNRDQDVLSGLASTLGAKFGAPPVQPTFDRGDPAFVAEDEVGLLFYLPVMERGNGTLPIAPFIEAFAPYASDLRIVYVIQGNFTYQGPWEFENADVTVKVDSPQSAPSGAVPFAFYGMHVTIKNPSLSSVSIEEAPEAPATRAFLPRLPMWMVILFAGAFGAAIGLILWQFLPRGKSTPRARRRHTTTSKRETRTHAGTRNDEPQ